MRTSFPKVPPATRSLRRAFVLVALSATQMAHASLFSGDTLDAVANVMAWVVLVIAPIIAVTLFWLVHILPERIAEKRHHPQLSAIKTLCLLSLFFGGLLWPLAWLWAYSKPVLYKIAYGKDTEPVEHAHAETQIVADAPVAEEAPILEPDDYPVRTNDTAPAPRARGAI